jgi:hypothetical protein
VFGGVAYFFIGGIYAMTITWPRFLRRHSDHIIGIRDDFEKSRDSIAYKGYRSFSDLDAYKNNYSARANKDRIVTYISTWVWDASWRVLRNPVVWSYNLVYDLFSQGFSKVERNVTAKILAEADETDAKKD